MQNFGFRLVVYALFLSGFGWAFGRWQETSFLPNAPRAEFKVSSQPIIAGPSILLDLQRHDAIVFDLRQDGWPLPGEQPFNAEKPPRLAADSKRPIVIVGEEAQAHRLASQWPGRAARYIVPERMLQFPSPPAVRRLSAATLRQQKARFHLIDLAEPEEWQTAHVAGSRRVSHLDLWNGDRSALPPRNEPLVVMCPTGARSWPVVQTLATEGYDVYDLRGGLLAWQGADLPTEGETP